MSRYRVAALALVALSVLPVPANAADDRCSSGLPFVDPNAASYHCEGVRPGMMMRVESKKHGWVGCGASFAFKDQFGQRYLTMPGTCFLDYECLEDVVLDELPPPLDELVEAVWPFCVLPTESELEPVYKRNGPVVRDATNARIGSVAYAVNKDGIDFALVRIDPAVRLDPSLPLYGGPTGLGTVAVRFEEAWVYSMHTGTGFNARAGLLDGTVERPYVHTEGIAATTRGASVMAATGEAIGMGAGEHHIGNGYRVQAFGPALARARSRTGLRLTLMTAPLR